MRVDVNGVGIEFDVTGDTGDTGDTGGTGGTGDSKRGRPVVLLHGFPDSGRLWRNQVPALVDAGFQVIVPDLRGYGRSDQPDGVESYSMPFLAGDVLGILDQLGIEKAHVVGHDWGAALAWVVAALVPDRVDHLVALSVGHPTSFRTAGREQNEKSWYMLLFQFPGVAEQWLSNDGWANLRGWGAHPDIDAVIADLEATGSLTPGLNWYRANVTPQSWVDPPMALPAVQAPTMGVWSSGDFALTERQMTASQAQVAGSWRYERVEGAGHWMQLEAADQVNRLLVDFLPR